MDTCQSTAEILFTGRIFLILCLVKNYDNLRMYAENYL